MALTLDDIMAAPSDPEDLNRHLLTRGLIAPPPPPEAPAPIVPPAEVTTPLSAVRTHPELANMTRPNIPKGTEGGLGAAPEIGGTPPEVAPTNEIAVKPMPALIPPTRKESIAAGKEEFAAGRPQITATDPKSPEFFAQRLAQDEYDRRHPWGSDISAHPGLLGKIGHYAGLVGQIAGGAIAPGVVAQIPGTRLNRAIREGGELEEMQKAQAAETAAGLEKTKELHEENIADVNQEKLQNAEDKLNNEQQKTLNARERDLRKQGLKPNPADPHGPPIPLTRADMSENEQAIVDLKQAQTGAAEAKAALDKIKADPNSPQNAAILERLQIMAKNAATAADKLGLDKKKFLADYYGMDEDFKPLAGVQMTPEGKPVGPKIAGGTQKALTEFNKNYEKPANDVEKSFQMFENAYAQHKAGQDPTGAQGMLALSTHLSTTFGNVKGARVTKDLIHEHLGARNITDDMLVAVQKLTNGDPLSPQQWDAFHQLIGESRNLSWTAAVKEAKRANLPVNFLPADLERTLNPEANKANAQPPRPPAPGMEWRKNKRTGEFKEFPVTR